MRNNVSKIICRKSWIIASKASSISRHHLASRCVGSLSTECPAMSCRPAEAGGSEAASKTRHRTQDGGLDAKCVCACAPPAANLGELDKLWGELPIADIAISNHFNKCQTSTPGRHTPGYCGLQWCFGQLGNECCPNMWDWNGLKP